jgi:YfiH family protein
VPLGLSGIRAWTTGRGDASFGFGSTEPVLDVMDRWNALQDALLTLGVTRLASATQVHGAGVARHDGSWRGWLRMRGVDGHMTTVPGTALAVTIADCTPVFLAHPRGAVAALHAGWRGTAAGILSVGLDMLTRAGFPAEECRVHLGPSICGGCYEVGPEVLHAVTGAPAQAKGLLDVRAVLAEQADRLGVRKITIGTECTRCHNDRFFSHRAGDLGRQLGVIALCAGE